MPRPLPPGDSAKERLIHVRKPRQRQDPPRSRPGLWLGLIAAAAVVATIFMAFLSTRQSPPQTRYPAVGDAAPDFTLPDASGGTFRLSDHLGGRNTLLFFHMGEG